MARFTPHTDEDVREMLDAIGVETLDDLFADVSPKFEGELNLPPALSEYEALREQITRDALALRAYASRLLKQPEKRRLLRLASTKEEIISIFSEA